MGAIYHAGTKYGGIGFDSFASIDTGTLLHSITSYNASWTATDDCWGLGYMNMGTATVSAEVNIDNAKLSATGASISHPILFPVKKGQVVSTRNATGQGYNINFYKSIKSSPQATAIDEENILRYPNYSDVIKSGATNNSTYTMPRDGWITGFFRYDYSLNGGNIAAIRVDNIYVACAYIGVSGVSTGEKSNLEAVLIPVKAGSVINFVNGTFTNINIVGTL